jgi:hypothetical protein
VNTNTSDESMHGRGSLHLVQFGFEPLEVVEGQSHARPVATAMFLPLREIAAAIE